jgi:sterol 3beta-glucosyltransferase
VNKSLQPFRAVPITILAIGSRGDVQPLVALGVALQRTGRYEIRLAASDDFEEYIRSWGLDFFPLGVNAQELLGTEAAHRILESGRNMLSAMWQLIQMLRPTLEQLMEGARRACQGVDAVVFSTLGMGAYHIAEKLGIPCFWALPFPFFCRTRSLPNLAFPRLPLGSIYNLGTHILVEQFAQQTTGRSINRWRRERLNLSPVSLFKWPYRELQGQPVPMFFCYSPAIVPKPSDWGDHVHVTGYWFLDHSPDWCPPSALVDFLGAGPAPVYIGFGSMSSRDPKTTAQIVLGALKESGQRAVIATGWGGMSSIDLPGDVFKIKAVPHTWLFPRMAAVVHHGGAGTTAAGLRAGVPSVIVPYFGDQSFWGRQVERLGVGPKPVPRKEMAAQRLGAAITAAVVDKDIRERAARLGERIRAEDGVARAVEVIDHYLPLTDR